MPTYLLSWNPKHWQWPDLAEQAKQVAAGQRVAARWSCGNTKVIAPGDRVFLIRLGQAPRGICGAGYVTSPPFYAPHWNDARRAQGDVTLYVMTELDWLVDPDADPDAVLPYHHLAHDPKFAGMNWRLQKSGARVPDDVAAAVATELRLAATGEFWSPTELPAGAPLTEGAVTTTTVDVRERNPQARRAAIARYGYSCSVCGFTFGDYYGAIADGYIEVHHLHPLAQADGERELDPAADLRPVCPNCHAVLHWRVAAPRELAELRAQIAGQVARGRVACSWFGGGTE